MGLKIMQISIGVAALVSLGTIVCCNLPFHSKAFSTGGVIPVFTISTYPLTVRVSFFCTAVFNAQWCLNLDQNHDLETVAQRFCAPGITTLFPNTCPGLKNAFGMGLATALCVFTNIVLNGIAGFLLYQYMNGSPKKNYRTVALICQCIGVMLIVMCLVVYIPAVIIMLDDATTTVPMAKLVISGSNATGVTKGYIFMWVCVIFQSIAICLSKFSKTSDESRFAEAKEHDKFMDEMNMYNQAAIASGQGGQGFGQQQIPGQQQMPQQWGGMQQQAAMQQPMPPSGFGGAPMSQAGWGAGPQPQW